MISKLTSNSISDAGITLGVFALFGVVLLAGVQWLTEDKIAENIRQRHLQRLHDIIDVDAYDNDLLGSVTERTIKSEGMASTLKVYQARLGKLCGVEEAVG